MVNTILNKSVQQIAPYYVQEEREIEKGDSEQMKAAMEYAKRSLWEDAREIWEMVLQDKSSDREDKIAATYNMGLYYEVSGELDLAEELFDRSFKISGDSKYLDSKARIKKRKKELKRLEKQDSLQVH